jgi:hypothetical protein
MLLVRAVVRQLRGGRRAFTVSAMLVVLANGFDGGYFVHHGVTLGMREGIHAMRRRGLNHMIRKASFVRAVWKPLLALAPTLPPHSVLVFDGVETEYFRNECGPQVWYRDSTITARDYLPADAPNDRLICFRLHDGVLQRIDCGELKAGRDDP